METAATYGFGLALDASYESAIPMVKEALKAEGFGVLSEIDVRATLKEKVGADMPPYLILGACNPSLAHKALTTEPNIGLMLPCNVVVRAEGGQTRVDFADPVAMLGVARNTDLTAVASEARQRLQRVSAALAERAQLG